MKKLIAPLLLVLTCLTTSFAAINQTVKLTVFCIGADSKETSSSVKELLFDTGTRSSCRLPVNLPGGKTVVVALRGTGDPTEIFVALEDPSLVLSSSATTISATSSSTNVTANSLAFFEGFFRYQTEKRINIVTTPLYTIDILFSTKTGGE